MAQGSIIFSYAFFKEINCDIRDCQHDLLYWLLPPEHFLYWRVSFDLGSWWQTCSGRKILYFGLARNLIRHLISPNQDELSYQPGPFFTGNKKLGRLPNPLSLVGQRRPVQTSHWPFFNNILFSWTTRPVQMSHCGSRIAAAAAWTHEGTHLIYRFLARNPSWI